MNRATVLVVVQGTLIRNRPPFEDAEAGVGFLDGDGLVGVTEPDLDLLAGDGDDAAAHTPADQQRLGPGEVVVRRVGRRGCGPGRRG